MSSEREQALRLARRLTPFELPVGVYVVTRDGRFIECNQQVRQILRLPAAGEVDASIADFYADPAERDRLHAEIERLDTEGRYMHKIIPLKVGGREIFVEDFSRVLRDEAGHIWGYLCCMVDVTEGERYNRLFETLPAGVYKLDENDRSVQANKAFARILGYDSTDEIADRPVDDFYVDRGEAARLRRLIEEKHPEPVNNFVAELRKKNGEAIFVNINAHKVEAEDGGYGGREGTIIDVTRQERYRRILSDVPVGLNVVRHLNGYDIIVDCNEQFARLFGFASAEEANGFDASQLHASRAEYERFRRSLEDAARQGHPLVGHRLKVVTLQGVGLTVEINSNPVKDSSGRVVARTSALRDITEEAELKDRVEELTFDIGKVLHDYTSNLLMTSGAVGFVISALGPDPFDPEKELEPDQAASVMAGPARELAASLEQLLDLSRAEDRTSALPAEKWETLSYLLAELRADDRNPLLRELHPLIFGEAANKLISICQEIPPHKFSRDVIRQVRERAQTLTRLASLSALHQIRDAIFEMDHQVSSLRDYITSNVRTKDPKVVCNVSTLIKQVRYNLEDYARSRGVKIVTRLERGDLAVEVVQRNVVRALANLLHNAVKYSWSREPNKAPWVAIRAYEKDRQVVIEMENWGVPIPKDELDQELIFEIGYRGKLSGDRGRVGTGIGLTDARRVARKHGGDVTIVSGPAVFGKREDDYKQPFLTTVTMRLPAHAG